MGEREEERERYVPVRAAAVRSYGVVVCDPSESVFRGRWVLLGAEAGWGLWGGARESRREVRGAISGAIAGCGIGRIPSRTGQDRTGQDSTGRDEQMDAAEGSDRAASGASARAAVSERESESERFGESETETGRQQLHILHLSPSSLPHTPTHPFSHAMAHGPWAQVTGFVGWSDERGGHLLGASNWGRP
jgi:hypothetical protein